jgi:hypothetical protein
MGYIIIGQMGLISFGYLGKIKKKWCVFVCGFKTAMFCSGHEIKVFF